MKLGREVVEYLKTQFVARQGKSSISDHLTPSINEAVNLGSSSYKWDTIYVRNLVADYLTGAGGNADQVDGFHAYAAPNANALLALNASSQYPGTVVQTGAGITVSGNDLVLAFSGNPSTIQPDDTAAGGSSSYAARTDHKHAITADAAGTISAGDGASEGTANYFARSDHVHGVNTGAPTTNLADDTTNQEGTSTDLARADHSHAITASSNPGATAELLKTAADGGVQLARLGIGIDPAYDNWVQMVANGQIGYYGGPNIQFDNANSELEILFGSNQRACFYDEGGLYISPTDTEANVYGFKYYADGDLSSPASRSGLTAYLYHNAGTAAASLQGIDALVRSGTNTGASINAAYGVLATAQANGGDITTAKGGMFQVVSPNASSLIGTGIGVNIAVTAGVGTITTGYGLKIENIDASTTYSIWTGTGKVRFGDILEFGGSSAEIITSANQDIEIKPGGIGLVSVGGTSPSAMLDIFDDTAQLRLTYASDTAKYAEFTVGSTGTVEWDAVSNIVLDPGANNVNPGGSIEDDLGAYNVKWRTLYAAEMYVENLVAQDVMATIGGRIMVAPTTKLTEDLTAVETDVDVEDASAFAANDYIYLCSAPGDPPVPQVEAMQITSIASNTLTVVRNKDGSGANTWLNGDAVVNLGYAAGEGYLELTSTQTIHADLGPTVAIYARTGTTNWNDVNPIVALGNLDSFLGYGTVYGLAIGNDLGLASPTSASFQGATLTQTDGLKLYNTDIILYDVATPKVQVLHDEGILMSSGTWGTDTTTFAAVFADDTTVTDLDAGDVIIGTPFHATQANRVGIHWDNSAGALKILGSLVVGAGYGVVIPDALLYCSFDGPMPVRSDFQVDTNTHLGGVATLSGAVIGQYGVFGKAVQVAETTANKIKNPSWELSASYWTDAGGLTSYSRSAYYHYFGDYAGYIYTGSATGGGDEYIYSDAATASVGQAWTFSIYIYKFPGNSSSTGKIKIRFLDSGSGSLGTAETTLDAGTHKYFKHYQVTGTAPASTAYVRAEVTMDGVVAADSCQMYLDGAQLEQKAYATPYCDGSMGIGHAWDGGAHASTSQRTAAGQLTYPDIVIPPWGSISVWVNSSAKISGNGNKRVILSAYDSFGIALYIGTDDKLYTKVYGSSLGYSMNDSIFPADTWHHIAVVFSPDEWTLYLNGEIVYQTASASRALDDDGGYDIGHEGGSYQWPGFIDDLIVTERYLTQTEVQVLYESQLPAYVRTNKYELMLTDAGHGKVLGSADGLFGWDSAGNEVFALVTAGRTWGSKSLSEGDLLLGDPDGDSYLWYDCSESKLFVQGGIYVGDFSGCMIQDASIHLPFDGPRPYTTDYQVNTNGHLGQKAKTVGGLIGRAGKFDKAVQIADLTTNKVPNPSAEVNTTGWNKSGGLLTFERVTTDSVFGTCCFHMRETSASGSSEVCYTDYIAASASTVYTFSISVKQVGYDVDDHGQLLVWWYNDVPTLLGTTTLNFDDGDFDWKRFQVKDTSPAGTTKCEVVVNIGIDAGDAADLYFDGVQMEQKSFVTPYCDGSLGAGHSWSGTEHASASSRLLASLKYEYIDIPEHGSVSFWYSPSYKMSENATERHFMDYGGLNGIRLRIWTNNIVYSSVGGSTSNYYTLSDSNCAPYTWHHFVFTWDKNNSEVKCYVDGVKRGNDGGYGTWNPSGSTLYVGCGITGNRVNGWIDDFLIVDYIFNETDVRRLYEVGASVLVPTNKFELMLTEPGAGKLVGNAGGIFGYDVSGNEAFALTTGAITWGGQAMAAGDMLLGDPSNNAHLFYDASAGQLLFRDSSKNTQVYIDTDGTLRACGGDIVLQDGNLLIWDRSASAGGTPYIDFYYDSTTDYRIAFITGDYGGGDAILWLDSVKYTGAPWSYCSTIVAAYDQPTDTSVRLAIRSNQTAIFSNVDALQTDGNFVYEGGLYSNKNSTNYDVYGGHFYTEPLTNTSWDGDSKTVGTYDIDTSTWGAPAGAKAVYLRLVGKWSTAGEGNCLAAKRKGGTAYNWYVRAKVANMYMDGNGWVTCDSNGDITIQVAGATSNNTYLQIWGYMI